MGTTAVAPMTKRTPGRIGQHLHFAGTIAMSSSYATGGDLLTAKSLGMNVIMGGVISPKSGYLLEIIPQVGGDALVKAYKGAAGVNVQETATTDLSAIIAFAEVWGR